MKILIFVVVYNAEKHIANTLSRISHKWLSSLDYKILIIDDASQDDTKEEVTSFIEKNKDLNIGLFTNEENKGYGGNQKLGYTYAFNNKYDAVVLLHGDGQYAPEYLPDMLDDILLENADVVLGSRMMQKKRALKGGMPLYKWIGNQVLTTCQNMMLGKQLSEFHTGYRAFSVAALRKIPLLKNSDYFDFDTEIIIQLIDTKARIKEISIPTFYGDEISYVNGLKYAWLILKATLVSRFVRRGWIKDSRFDYIKE